MRAPAERQCVRQTGIGIDMAELTLEDWRRVDSLLAESQVLSAVVLYRDVTGSGIAEAKEVIGDRFRIVCPEEWRHYREVAHDDE